MKLNPLKLYYYKNLTNFFSYFSIFILFFSIALLNCDFFVSCEDIDSKDQNCAVETQKESVSKYKLIAIFIVATFIGFYFTGAYFDTFPLPDRGPDSPK